MTVLDGRTTASPRSRPTDRRLHSPSRSGYGGARPAASPSPKPVSPRLGDPAKPVKSSEFVAADVAAGRSPGATILVTTFAVGQLVDVRAPDRRGFHGR